MKLLTRRRPGDPAAMASPLTRAVGAMVADACLELVPVKHVEESVGALPPASQVSVTCSPAKGIAATQDLTSHPLDLGHDVVPHLAARMVIDRADVARIAGWLRVRGVREIFVVGGDDANVLRPHRR